MVSEKSIETLFVAEISSIIFTTLACDLMVEVERLQGDFSCGRSTHWDSLSVRILGAGGYSGGIPL